MSGEMDQESSVDLIKTLRPFDFKPVFYNVLTLKQFLTPLNDRTHDNERSDVYKLECGDCSGVYIGETGRRMITRVLEHLSPWYSSSFGRSAFTDYLLIAGHRYKGWSTILLHHEDSIRRKALEEIEIYHYFSDSL